MKKILTILLFVTSLVFGSCGKEGTDNPDPKPKDPIVIPGNQPDPPTFTEQGGSASYQFTANTVWTADIAATRAVSWCSVSPTSGGKGEVNLSIQAQPNDTPDDRNATVTLHAGDAIKTFSVTQKQKDALTLTSSKIEIDAEGGTFEIEVKANIDFTVELGDDCKDDANKSWVSQNQTRALQSTHLQFGVEANEDLSQREGTITIRSSEGAERFKIYQAGTKPVLVLTQRDYTVASAGETIKVEIKSNVDYSVTMPQADWIRESTTRTVSTHTRYYEIAPNETPDNRTAEIVFKDNKNGLTQTVNVTQLQKDALVVAKNNYTLTNSGGEITIAVNHNVDFDVVIDQPWVMQIGTRALATDNLKFKVTENSGYDNREAKITFTSKDKTKTQEVKVYQAQKNAIVVSQKEYTVSDAGGEVEIEVRANVDFSVEGPGVAWLHKIETRAMTLHTLRYTVDPNSSYDLRTAIIKITDKDNNLSETVTVTQVQKNAIVVAKNSYTVANEGGEIKVEVGHNVDFDVAFSENWITQITTRGLVTDYLTFKVAENPSDDNREAKIIFTSKDKSQKQEITVYQTQKNILILPQHEYDLADTGGNITVEINTNVEFSVEIAKGDTWLHQISTRGVVSHTLEFQADQNTTYDPREASIIITNAACGIKETVSVRQSQKDAIILGAGKYDVPQTASNLNIKVKSNIDYQVAVTEGADWITRIEGTRALTESVVSLKIDENTTSAPREGKVTISDVASKIESVITIAQAANTITEDQTIHVETPGTLSQLISAEELRKIAHLKFTGSLNDEDLKMLSVWPTSSSRYDFKTETLDVSEVVFDKNTINGFNGLPYLREVHLPPTLKKVGYAFDACPALTTVDFGPNPVLEAFGCGAHQRLQTIDNRLYICGAFSNCTSLVEMDIPESVTKIEGGAFYGSGVARINFAKNCRIESFDAAVIQIMNPLGAFQDMLIGTFSGCAQLETIEIPSSVIEISEGAFMNWNGLKTLVIPETVKCINTKSLFSGCSSLQSVSLPSCTTVVGDSMFSGCRSLTSFDFAAGYETLGAHAFSGSGLREIRIPDNIKEIPQGAFYNCSQLQTVDLNKTEIISSYAFQNSSLGSVTLPASVREVYDYAFDCPDLTEVILLGGNVKLWEAAFLKQHNEKPLKRFYVGKNVVSVTAMRQGKIFDADFNNFEFEEGSHCEEFGIYSGLNLSSISLPSSVRKLGPYAFYGCMNLTNPEALLKGIEEIGEAAFSTTNLTSITIPEGVKKIGAFAFDRCKSLRHFTLPSTLTYLGKSAFRWCSKLLSSTLNGADLICGEGIFSSCPYLSTITIAKNIVSLTAEDDSYGILSQYITEVVFEEGSKCRSIDGPLFCWGQDSYGKNNLTSIVLPPSLTRIGQGVFENCSKLTALTVPENVKEIDHRAFSGCRGLQTLTIGSCVTSLSPSAFNYCTGQLYIDSNLPDHTRKHPYLADFTSLHVGKNVSSISAPLYSWKKLETVYCCSTTPPALQYRIGADVIVYVPRNCISIYASAWEGKVSSDRIREFDF